VTLTSLANKLKSETTKQDSGPNVSIIISIPNDWLLIRCSALRSKANAVARAGPELSTISQELRRGQPVVSPNASKQDDLCCVVGIGETLFMNQLLLVPVVQK
jgi:hypothetical protein